MMELNNNVRAALDDLGMKTLVQPVTKMEELMKFRIDGIPALAVDGTVVLQKKVPEVEDLKILLSAFSEASAQQFNMKTILVPTDFSLAAKDAFHFSLDLAARMGSVVKAVHVWHPEFDPQQPYLYNEARFATDEDAKKRLSTFVEEETRETEGGAVLVGARAEQEVMVGFPVDEILQLSEQPEVDLIVMGSTGEKGFLTNLFGSVSTNVAQRASCPVLLVPEGVSFHGFRHILYASDYEAAERPMLHKLVDFANVFKADIHFVHVNTEDKPESQDYEEVKNNLFKVLFEGREPSFAFNVSQVEGRSVVQGLNEYALQHHIDLVVMVRPNRDFWENLFHKSITKRMVLNTRLPILVLHE